MTNRRRGDGNIQNDLIHRPSNHLTRLNIYEKEKQKQTVKRE